MITIGRGSSRPASSIPIPGTSHATAISAGNCVTAANTHPGSHHPRCDRRRTVAAADTNGAAKMAGADSTLVAVCAPVTASSPFSSEFS